MINNLCAQPHTLITFWLTRKRQNACKKKQKHIDEHIHAILADSCISVADLSLTIIIGEGQIPSCSVFSCHHMSRDGWMFVLFIDAQP